MERFSYCDNNFIEVEIDGVKKKLEDNELFKGFSNSMREIRLHIGLSILQLSKIIGIPHQTLSSYETMSRVPSFIQAIKISSYFQISLEEMIVFGLDYGPFDICELYDFIHEKKDKK